MKQEYVEVKQLRIPLGNLIAGNRTGEELDKGAQMVLQAMDGRNGVYVYRRPSVQHMISGFNMCSFSASSSHIK